MIKISGVEVTYDDIDRKWTTSRLLGLDKPEAIIGKAKVIDNDGYMRIKPYIYDESYTVEISDEHLLSEHIVIDDPFYVKINNESDKVLWGSIDINRTIQLELAGECIKCITMNNDCETVLKINCGDWGFYTLRIFNAHSTDAVKIIVNGKLERTIKTRYMQLEILVLNGRTYLYKRNSNEGWTVVNDRDILDLDSAIDNFHTYEGIFEADKKFAPNSYCTFHAFAGVDDLRYFVYVCRKE